MIRQGDLLFVPIEAVPNGFKPMPGKSVLAYGEVTGHAHRIEGLGHDEAAVLENGAGEIVVDARARSLRVPHEEHDAVVLSGLYRMERQREYDPDEAAREKKVRD